MSESQSRSPRDRSGVRRPPAGGGGESQSPPVSERRFFKKHKKGKNEKGIESSSF